jgi:DNA mismatch endonuclease (patch repair protein)
MLVRRFLHARGFRYRLHGGKAKKGKPAAAKALAGKPDIVLPKYKTVIFVHGCFWHGHANCKYFKIPATRTEWWMNKIDTNKANDARAIKSLRKDGWTVITIWECALKPLKAQKTLSVLLRKLG